MLSVKEESLKVKKISAEERKKEARLRDVTLLLQQIVEREETSLKLIIDCLIDVGSINYANAKLSNPPLNKMMKVLVGYIKPIARRIALGWLKKNLPDLLTAWLEGKVSFETTPANKDEATATTENLATIPEPTNEAINTGIEPAPFKESF